MPKNSPKFSKPSNFYLGSKIVPKPYNKWNLDQYFINFFYIEWIRTAKIGSSLYSLNKILILKSSPKAESDVG